MDFNGILDKKIGPVPIVYLAAGMAAILGVVAWRMKPSASSSNDTTTDTGDATLDENGIADGTDPYAGFRANGTVIVQPPTPTPEDKKENRPTTNDEWIREGAEWLIATKNASGTAAYSALSKYVRGQSRSNQEQQWVEMVIAEKGFPPDNFSETPLPSSPSPSTPQPTGYRGYGWVRADGRTNAKQYAEKYRIPLTLFYTFNPGSTYFPKAGTYLKVRANSNPLTGYRG